MIVVWKVVQCCTNETQTAYASNESLIPEMGDHEVIIIIFSVFRYVKFSAM